MPAPALVYCTEATDRDAVDDYLYSQALYRHDDLPELLEDARKRVLERPLLRRLLLFTNRSGVTLGVGDPPSMDDEPAPERLIVDHLGTLGPDLESQVAVVGAFLGSGVRVTAGYQEVEPSWYYEQIRRLDSRAVHRLVSALLENPPFEAHRECWQARNPGPAWFLATTHCPIRSYGSAKQRIAELVHSRGLTPTAVAPKMQVAGYRNRKGRVRWYPKAVQDALQETS